MLVIHEPLLQTKKAFIVNPSLLKYPPNQIRESLLKKGNLLVYRAHSNWDDAEEGNNVVLAKTLGLKLIAKLPYGRIGRISPIKMDKFIKTVKERLGCRYVLVVGEQNQVIRKVAVVSGSGNSLTDIIELAKQKRADVLVSGDLQDSRARFAKEQDFALIDAGGYYTETPGMKYLAELLQERLQGVKVFYLDPGPPWEVV